MRVAGIRDRIDGNAPSTEATEAEKHGRDDENQDVQQEPKVKKPRLEVDGMTYSTRFIMPTGYDFHVVYKRVFKLRALMGIGLSTDDQEQEALPRIRHEPTITVTEFANVVRGARVTLFANVPKLALNVLKASGVFEPVMHYLHELDGYLITATAGKPVPTASGNMALEKAFEAVLDVVKIINQTEGIWFPLTILKEPWREHMRRVVMAFIKAHAAAVFALVWDDGELGAFW